MKKEGDNTESYFISKKLVECPIHRSITCGCKNFVKSETETVLRFLDFYKYSSNVLTYSNGKIKYVKKDKKTTVRFNCE